MSSIASARLVLRDALSPLPRRRSAFGNCREIISRSGISAPNLRQESPKRAESELDQAPRWPPAGLLVGTIVITRYRNNARIWTVVIGQTISHLRITEKLGQRWYACRLQGRGRAAVSSANDLAGASHGHHIVRTHSGMWVSPSVAVLRCCVSLDSLLPVEWRGVIARSFGS